MHELVTKRGLLTTAICLALCGIFASTAWFAVRGKSVTYDEPMHATAAWMAQYHADFRFFPDAPALWDRYIGLGIGKDSLHTDLSSESYRHFTAIIQTVEFAQTLLYQTPGNDALRVIARGRAMSLALACAFLLLLARWAWEIAGSVAAIAAAFLFAFDPALLGNAPLIKNDVAIAALYFAGCYALWRAGKHLTLFSLSAVALTFAAALLTKLSGALLWPSLILLLAWRVISDAPWPCASRFCRSRSSRAVAACAIIIATLVVTYALLWVSYGFRFDASPGGYTFYELPASDILPVRLIQWARYRHLIPEAWAVGFVQSHTLNIQRDGFLFGTTYTGGRWYYFPLAILVKEPLATLAACLFIAGSFVLRFTSRPKLPFEQRWTLLATLIPASLYALAAVTADLNIGIRHILPIYPFVFLAIAILAARTFAQGRPSKKLIVLFLAGALAAESLCAFPNYLAFFNIGAGGPIGGYAYLSDSNLDWGQDLPLLAAWHRQHPDVPLHVIYFGLAEPAYYGIPKPPPGSSNGVLAISASRLRFLPRDNPALGTYLQSKSPIDVLGGTIYLYRLGN